MEYAAEIVASAPVVYEATKPRNVPFSESHGTEPFGGAAGVKVHINHCIKKQICPKLQGIIPCSKVKVGIRILLFHF